MESIILVANPGSSYKKYALFKRNIELARICIEHDNNGIVAHITKKNDTNTHVLTITSLEQATNSAIELFIHEKVIKTIDAINGIAIPIVAPGEIFLQDKYIGEYEIEQLRAVQSISPLYITATLAEIEQCKYLLPAIPIYGISDSAFHATKPDYAWNYAINLEDADRYGIKRFGYNGIVLESVIKQLQLCKYDASGKVIICYLGSEASVTAIYNSKSVDTTLGYSPLEGLVIGTHSGSVELSVGLELAKRKNISPEELVLELNNNAGLKGIGGIEDIQLLIQKETEGDYRAGLALSMYVYSVRQAIAQMAATLGGVDMLVFTGAVGQQSHNLRKRIVDGLDFLQLALKDSANAAAIDPDTITAIHPRTRIKPIVVAPTQEERTIALHAHNLHQ